MATITLMQALMFILGVPAAVWAGVQVYNYFFGKQPSVSGTPVSYRKTKALTWTTKVEVIEKK
jgi:hypothetical protein